MLLTRNYEITGRESLTSSAVLILKITLRSKSSYSHCTAEETEAERLRHPQVGSSSGPENPLTTVMFVLDLLVLD